jgi:hypothetical protein
MKPLKKLTKEQENHIPVFRKKWEDLFYKNQEIDKDKCEKGIAFLYKEFLQRKCPPIYYMNSNMGCQILINLLANWNILSDTLKEDIKEGNLAHFPFDKLQEVIKSTKIKAVFHTPAFYSSVGDYGWISFYDFIQYTNHFKKYDFNTFNKYKEFLQSGIYEIYVFENVCVVCSIPKISQDEQRRLHNTDKFAVKFKDGFEMHFIHGRFVPTDIFDLARSGKLTKERFVKEKNEEIRAAWYEILGEEKVCELLGAETVDKQIVTHKNGDQETIALLKTKEIFEEAGGKLAWVKYVCPSTEQVFLVPCESRYTNAKEAAISQSIFKNVDDYSFDVRT